MRKLIWKECKRMFFKPSIFILLIVSCVGNIVLTTNFDSLDQQTREEERAIKHEYAGEINQAWEQRLQKDFTDETIENFLPYVDETEMINTYGTHWESEFCKEPLAYEQIIKSKEQEGYQIYEGKKPFYVMKQANSDHLPPTTLRYQVLETTLFNKSPFLQKQWNNPVIDEYKDQEGNIHRTMERIPTNIANDPEQLNIFQDHMNQAQYYFDDASGWAEILNTMAISRFFLALIIIYITSKCINQEYSSHTMDAIKSTKFGKYKLIFVKLIAILLCSSLLTLCYTAIFVLFHSMTLGLGNWNVNASAITGNFTPYTYKEVFFGGFAMLLCGAITCGFITAVFSTYLKKSYTSFAIGILSYVLPLALPSELQKLFPINYMDFSGIYFYSDMMKFMDTYLTTPNIIIFLTILVFIGCCCAIVPRYRSYAITQE